MIKLCDDVKFETYIPNVNKFILDVSEMDVDLLGYLDTSANSEWVDFTSKSIELSIDRGADLYNNNGFARSDASTLVVTGYEDDYDPNDREAVFPGMPVRVTVNVGGTWETIFTGKMQSLNTEYTREGKAISTLTAQDDIERLNNYTLYRGNDEGVADRLAAIATDTDTTINVKGTSTIQLAPKETPVSAWELIDLAMTSEGGFIFPVADGTLTAWMRGYRENTITIDFSDVHDDTDPKHHCYSGLNIEKTADRVVNTVRVINIKEAGLDGQDKEEALPVWKDQGSIDVYGPKELELRTNVVSLSDGNELAEWVGQTFLKPKIGVQSLEFEPDETKFTTVDVGDNVALKFKNIVDDEFMVSQISHVIDADGWKTTLGLFKRGGTTKWL